jgi:hypothetical protein
VVADVLIKASQDVVTTMNQDDLAAEPGEDASKFEGNCNRRPGLELSRAIAAFQPQSVGSRLRVEEEEVAGT